MRYKISFIMLFIFILLSFNINVYANDKPTSNTKSTNKINSLQKSIPTYDKKESRPIYVKINDELQIFSQEPVLLNSKTMVPMRGIFEKLGAKVIWNAKNQTITAIKDDNTINLQVNNKIANHNDTKIVLEQAPVVINGSTLVPVRFVAESLGVTVGWDENTWTVLIYENHVQTPTQENDKPVDNQTVEKDNKNIPLDPTFDGLSNIALTNNINLKYKNNFENNIFQTDNNNRVDIYFECTEDKNIIQIDNNSIYKVTIHNALIDVLRLNGIQDIKEIQQDIDNATEEVTEKLINGIQVEIFRTQESSIFKTNIILLKKQLQ